VRSGFPKFNSAEPNKCQAFPGRARSQVVAVVVGSARLVCVGNLKGSVRQPEAFRVGGAPPFLDQDGAVEVVLFGVVGDEGVRRRGLRPKALRQKESDEHKHAVLHGGSLSMRTGPPAAGQYGAAAWQVSEPPGPI
jgi:hypothetical protein